MRLRICRELTGSVDGVALDQYRTGSVYEVGASIAKVLLAEGSAEHVGSDVRTERVGPTSGRISALVLVVDDDPEIRKLTVRLLARNGYRVIEAQHGGEGIRRLIQDTPDLVVLDLNMPVMDGWQFRAAQLRLQDGRLSHIPVLVVTGAEGARAHAARLKAVGVIEKPFDPDRFLDAIKGALRW